MSPQTTCGANQPPRQGGSSNPWRGLRDIHSVDSASGPLAVDVASDPLCALASQVSLPLPTPTTMLRDFPADAVAASSAGEDADEQGRGGARGGTALALAAESSVTSPVRELVPTASPPGCSSQEDWSCVALSSVLLAPHPPLPSATLSSLPSLSRPPLSSSRVSLVIGVHLPSSFYC